MGLDMYLHAARPNERLEDSQEIGYWRKFSALHDILGRDSNCQFIPVSRETIENLIQKCDYILQLTDQYLIDENGEIAYKPLPDDLTARIAEILPPVSGFFFGNLSIDERYLYNVRKSLSIFHDALTYMDNGYEIYYYAWW